MNKTFTFISENRFRVTCLETFKRKFFNHPPESFALYNLISEYDLLYYLHSESGYALLDLQTGSGSYWLAGQAATEKQIHDIIFKNKINNLLDEE